MPDQALSRGLPPKFVQTLQTINSWRTFVNNRILSVQEAFQFDNRDTAIPEPNRVVVPVSLSRRIPLSDEASILHMIQNVFGKFTLRPHCCRKLTANPLYRTTKEAAVVELFLIKAMRTEFVCFGFERFSKLFNQPSEILILRTWNHAHAAVLVLNSEKLRMGSKR